MPSREHPPLWSCPKCGKKFVTKNLWHSCVRIPLDHHFAGKDPKVKRLYNAYLKLVKSFGPVIVNVSKTRIEFQARMRFAGVPRVNKDHIIGGFLLVRKIESPRFSKVEFIPPRYWVYQFPIRSLADLDAEVCGWIAEAYGIGMQEHVTRTAKQR